MSMTEWTSIGATQAGIEDTIADRAALQRTLPPTCSRYDAGLRRGVGAAHTLASRCASAI